MVKKTRFIQFAILMVMLLLLAGCGSSAPANFYLLQAQPVPASLKPPSLKPQPPAVSHKSIGIGPVEIPEYLDRPQLVTLTGGNTVQIHEFERWAEPLREGVTRVVTDNLAGMLATDPIEVYPWKSQLTVDYRLALTLNRFEAAADGQTTLAGWWTLYDTANRRVSLRKPVLLTGSIESNKVSAMVDGQSRLLARLCEEIAGAVRHLPATMENKAEESIADQH
jgi:uncharacterized lipoprotein YmbA